MDQQKIGLFLKELRKEKRLTQEQLAEKLNVTGRTVSRWETGVNLPDLSLLVELADYYEVDIREIIDGERKSETMDTETKETLLKVSDYAAADKKQTVKKTKRKIIALLIVLICFTTLSALALNFFFGNPISKALAIHNAETIVGIMHAREGYQVTSAVYWIDYSEYLVRVKKPGSPDASFMMHFGMFGNYRFDEYDIQVGYKQNIVERMGREYTALVRDALADAFDDDPEGFCYSEIIMEDNTDYDGFVGLSRDEIEQDQSFDYDTIGKDYGKIVVMLDDTDLSAEHLAQMLLKVKNCLDAHNVAFQLVDLSLMEPSSRDLSCVWGFRCDDIYEEGLVERVEAAMNK
ncbi:MAG: helix-turn-helix domain-containing protein [Clostridia bacterium]|nr:helix-turn-helix domain-containing protein [Clostridia bacterium]